MMSVRPISKNTDGPQKFASKTPGRTQSRAENVYRGPATVHGKGKNVLLQTPFNPSTKQLSNEKEGTVARKLAPLQPLLDKTPFHNRTGLQLQTPYGVSTPDSVLRPSSLRQHIRAPQSSGTPKGFQTPMNTRNPWDCDISIGSPEVASQELSAILDDDENVEYTPSNTLDLPYYPPLDFDLPNYKKMGDSLRNIARLPVYDNTPPPDPDPVVASDLGITWDNMLELPELESNDPFHLMSKSMKTRTAATRPLVRSTSVRPTPTLRARSVLSTNKATFSSRVPAQSGVSSTSVRAKSTEKAKISRPATALSSRGPSAQRPAFRAGATKRPERVVSRTTTTQVVQKKQSDGDLCLNVAHSDTDDFMFAI